MNHTHRTGYNTEDIIGRTIHKTQDRTQYRRYKRQNYTLDAEQNTIEAIEGQNHTLDKGQDTIQKI
jgi:hypothetical protein